MFIPALPTNLLMSANPMPEPRSWLSVSAQCCWRRPATSDWSRCSSTKYALYRHGDSEHPRELHLKWNNSVLPVDHPWWNTHSPSNGYGCKCKKFLLSAADLKQRGLEVGKAPDDGDYEWVDKATGELHKIPRGIDPGFDYRPQTRPP